LLIESVSIGMPKVPLSHFAFQPCSKLHFGSVQSGDGLHLLLIESGPLGSRHRTVPSLPDYFRQLSVSRGQPHDFGVVLDTGFLLVCDICRCGSIGSETQPMDNRMYDFIGRTLHNSGLQVETDDLVQIVSNRVRLMVGDLIPNG
jgi:hypothetical protein